MKRLLQLLSGLVLLAFSAQAQSANPAIWCPFGSEWTYPYALFSEQGTIRVTYVNDTIIGGQSAQKLYRSCNTYFSYPGGTLPGSGVRMPPVFTRVVADRVEVYANGQFYTLYNFAAQPGDSWLTPVVYPQGNCAPVTMVVDSVGRQTLNGRSLRWFRATPAPNPNGQPVAAWPGRVYELLGSIKSYMQPSGSGCGGTDPGYMGPLETFGAPGPPPIRYQFNYGVLLGTTATAAPTGLGAFPNPSAGQTSLSLQLPANLPGGVRLRLFDLAGRQVREQAVPAGRQLDVRGLPTGIYTLLLSNAGQPDLRQRIVLD